MPTHSSTVLQPIFGFLEYALDKTERAFHAIPGSAVVNRYIQSSHRNDPGRTVLELLLFIFALWTVFQSRRRAGLAAKNFVKLTEQVRGSSMCFVLLLIYSYSSRRLTSLSTNGSRNHWSRPQPLSKLPTLRRSQSYRDLIALALSL